MKLSARFLALLLTASSCGLPPMVSDTGYAGTWQRGNGRVTSIVALAPVSGRYRFWLDLRSEDGEWVTSCTWAGDCELRVRAVPIYRYRVRSWIEPTTNRLRVEFDGVGVSDPKKTDHYVDEFVVEPGGMRLECNTIMRDGMTYPENGRPKRTFTKVANSVAASPFDLREPKPATVAGS